MNPKTLASGATLAALTWLAPALCAQTSAGAGLRQELTGWQDAHGANWAVRMSDDPSYVRMLFGGTAAGTLRPQSDADYFALAHAFVDQAAAMTGIGNGQLVDDTVMLLPLATIGTTDKVAVNLRQEIGGVPVEHGSVSLLFTPSGDLLALDANGIPASATFSVVPTIDAGTAFDAAVADFESATGTPVTRSGQVTLNVIRQDSRGHVVPALAWHVQLWNETEGFIPESYVYQVAAQGQPSVLRKDDAIHHFDVGGTVTAMTTPGNRPDIAANPPAPETMPYMTVTASGVGSTKTDASGNFNFPGVNGPVNVTFSFLGSYDNVNNQAGGDYSLTQSLTGTGNSVVLNSSPSATITAQANGYARTNSMRDWTRSINPNDGMMDFLNVTNVNINSSCNAFYDGSSTNFYHAAGGCVNTAYSTVVWHEQGHWQNDRYGSGNGFDGFGEGNADVFAMYQADNPIVGDEFFGQGGGFIRTGLNLRQYCGDGNGGCYGEVHNDGEVLMGVLWKVRANLQATYGDTPGGDIANLLFNGWMNAYNQGTINSIIETQWLTLDDDDGNINNGTPNYNDINDAFLVQGFPGVTPPGSPTSAFTADITVGSAPLTVNFTDLSSDNGNPITAWSWDFGDGSTSTLQNPSHIYLAEGTYDVSLQVTNAIASNTKTELDYIVITAGGPASATPRNGSGINPNIFASSNLPIIGTTWTSTVDAGSVGGTGLSFVFGFSNPLNPGIVLGVGELLIDSTSSFQLINTALVVGGTATHNAAIPSDPSLVGLFIATQAFLNNVNGSGLLCNAIDVVLGTF